jgi:hypothetical protein
MNWQIQRFTGAGRMAAITLFSLGIWLGFENPDALAQGSFNQPGGISYNADGTILLHWTGPGTLESAPTLAGPWTTVTGGATYTGSATETVSDGAAFFRLNTGTRTGVILPAPTIPPLPPIVSATIQRLATPTPVGDTVLAVTFQQQPGVPVSASNFFELNGQIYMLRDDGVYPDTNAGDGVYTAIVPVDTNDLAAWNNHVDYVAANGNLMQPVFTGRIITSSNMLTKFNLTNFIVLHLPITLLPFPCSLGASDLYNWRKTIMIEDLSVVSDPVRTFDPCGPTGTPMGPWTFGFLMSNMCNQAVTGINPSDFVMTWLRNWEFDQSVNSDIVPNRSNAIVTQVINNWLGPTGTNLNLANAPFRLLAIVNRLDLRSHNFPYDNAGELRFVFGVIDPSNPCSPSPLPFTVILEYGVPLQGCSAIKGWANQWAALNSIPFGPTYNAALEAITDQITMANSDPTKPPNFSAINQIRANDMLTSPWDLREFIISPTGYLVEHTVKNTPAGILNDTPIVTTYCTDPTNVANILVDNFTVPVVYSSVPFLGAHAPIMPPGIIWNGSPPFSIPPPQRIHFSLNTCNGCHGGETLTAFTHISPRPPGAVAALSAFLTGETVVDPGGSGITNRYSDLARRVADLDMVVNKPCVCLSLLRPMTMPH